MRLSIGSNAPNFAVEALGGQKVDLAALRGRTVLLKFYRFATCPVCNLHLHRFTQDYRMLEALGLTTVVLFHSPAAKIEQSRKRPRTRTEKGKLPPLSVAALYSEESRGGLPPFALAADPDKRIFKAYGVETGWAGMFSPTVMRDYIQALNAGFPAGMLTSDGGVTGKPADFIIDAEGKIAFAHYGRHYADSLDAAEIVEIRRRLDTGRPSPVGMDQTFNAVNS